MRNKYIQVVADKLAEWDAHNHVAFPTVTNVLREVMIDMLSDQLRDVYEYVYRNRNVTSRQIMRLLDCSQTHASTVLNQLADIGLLTRYEHVLIKAGREFWYNAVWVQDDACCVDCGLRYTHPAWIKGLVSNDVWRMIEGDNDILCIHCIARRCERAELEDIPVALVAGPLVNGCVDKSSEGIVVVAENNPA